MKKLAIKSNHIYPDPYSPSFPGYILIEDSLIQSLIPLTYPDLPSLLSSYTLLDYTNFYVMPGLIDINTHLNSCFDEEWQDIENITKQALMGGVTTLIDNPIMNHKSINLDESISINSRVKSLEKLIYTDCGLLGYLGPNNLKDYKRIYDETGVLGFKIYLSQTFEPNLPGLTPQDLLYLGNLLESNKLEDLVLSINCEMASNRDLFMASPCRNCPIEQRLDLNFDIHNMSGFGGGHHGVFKQEKEGSESNRKNSKSVNQKFLNVTDDNLIDIIQEIKTLEKSTKDHYKSPSTAYLNLNSQLMSNILEQKHVSDLELLDYEQASVTLKTLDEKKTGMNFNFLDSDSNLEDNEKFFHDSNQENDENSSKDISLEDKEPDDNLSVNIKDQGQTIKQKDDSTFIELEEAKLEVINRGKRMSYPFLKDQNDIIVRAFEIAMTEELKEERETKVKIFKEKIIGGTPSSFRKLSSFSEKRKTFTEKKTDSSGPFKGLPSIMTKKCVETMKEQKKNRNYAYFLPNHPVSWEINGINQVLKAFCHLSKVPINNTNIILTNLSSPCLAFQVRDIKKILPDIPIYTDTASPFIFFNKDMIKLSETKFKHSPPIRDIENQYFLVRSVKALIFDSVSSYHLSVPKKYKDIDKGNFRRAFNGINSIGGSLSMVWSKFYSILRIREKKGIFRDREAFEGDVENLIKKLVYLMSYNPSKMLFLDGVKGTIKEGKHADLMVWDPFKVRRVNQYSKDLILKEKKRYCLDKYKVYGEVVMTVLRGEVVFRKMDNGELEFRERRGEVLHNKGWEGKKKKVE